MNRITVLLVLLIAAFIGCENPTPAGIDDVQLDSINVNSCAGSPCSKIFYLSFIDHVGVGFNHWYWGEVDGVPGKPVELFNNGSRLQVKVTANYFDFPSSVSSYLHVARSNNSADAGKKASGRGQLPNLEPVPLFDNDCWMNCCTDKELDKGWYYATALFDTNSVVGIKAQILTRYGELCGECASSTKHSHQVVFVNISNDDASLLWGQTGYIHQRLSGDANSVFGCYAEINADYYDMVIDSVYRLPFEGSWHHYETKLDPSAGEFRFAYDYTVWVMWEPQVSWTGKTGTSCQWTAEIYGRETDMGSDASNPCSLSVCEFQLDGGSYEYANFSDPNMKVGGTDFNEWDIAISATTPGVYIWDKNLLPSCK